MRSLSFLLIASLSLSAAPALAGPAKQLARQYGISVKAARAALRTGTTTTVRNATGPAVPGSSGSTVVVPGSGLAPVGPAN